MLTLDPDSSCDVCMCAFTSVQLPHCIDCGHIFCLSCLDSICEKTWSPRQLPACPFCREPFTKNSVRKIRVDIKTPPRPPAKEIQDGDMEGALAHPSEAKRLEEKVAKAAASKCSFEEVFELHKEIQQWLASEVKRTSTGEHASLQLSAALLRAILQNFQAYSEASRVAKDLENDLKERLETVGQTNDDLEAKLHSHRSIYSQKVRECEELRSELNRVKLMAIPSSTAARPLAIGVPPRSASSPSPMSRSTSTRSAAPPSPSPQSLFSSRFSRPASTTPPASIMNGVAGHHGLVVGSAPTSHTFASAMKLRVSHTKPRQASPYSFAPPADEKPHERWMPNTDDESIASEKSQFSYRTSASDRSLSSPAIHRKWTHHFHMPPVTV